MKEKIEKMIIQLCNNKMAEFPQLYKEKIGEQAVMKMKDWAMELVVEMQRMGATEELITESVTKAIANFLLIKKSGLTPQIMAGRYLNYHTK